jgi:hypothetical protein
LLDTVNLLAAVRHEDFSGGLSATVYKVSGKWDVTPNLAIRGSYGDNFQAPPATLQPGNVTNAVRSYAIAAGNWRGAQFVTRSDVVPETAISWNAGAIWQSQGLTADSDFRIIVDYFDIQTEDELGQLADVNDIANAVFSGAVAPNGFNYADCGHALVDRVTFNGGSCVAGTTTADDFASIRTDFGNGPGQHTAGIDFTTDYSFPFFAGDLRLGATATKVEIYEIGATTLDGVLIEPARDQLGLLNFATIAVARPEWRANFNANYNTGAHNFRAVLNYVSAVEDARGPLTPSGFIPGTFDPYGPTDYGVDGENYVTGDFHYQFETPWDATISASVVNVTDEDPPAAREEFGYDPLLGSPLGRTIEFGIRKTF